jgi:hypothetical protein
MAAEPKPDPYLVNLRRELTLALARLKRAERERDKALAEAARLRKRLESPGRLKRVR